MIRLVLCVLAGTAALAQVPDCAVVQGAVQKGEARSFDTETLYEYMNGNSEGYFLYGFVKMRGVTCEKGVSRFNLDISEFKDAESAYGMFMSAMDARQPVTAIGMGGQVLPRRLAFAKGKYYVEMSAEPEPDYTPVLRASAQRLSEQTPGESTLPPALTWFPADGIKAGTVVRLIPQSVLGLRMLERGYLGQYDRGKAFVVTTESPAAATGLLKKLRERLGPGEPTQAGEESFTVEDKYLGRLCMFRKGSRIGGWANVAPGFDPQTLAREFAAKLP